MTKSDSDFPLALKGKGQEVKIYKSYDRRRSEDYSTVVFYLGNHRHRKGRKKLADAEKLADEVLRQMVANRVPVSLTPEVRCR